MTHVVLRDRLLHHAKTADVSSLGHEADIRCPRRCGVVINTYDMASGIVDPSPHLRGRSPLVDANHGVYPWLIGRALPIFDVFDVFLDYSHICGRFDRDIVPKPAHDFGRSISAYVEDDI